ncbi:MAG: shikimate kinase [Rickettsiales bacterium]|nr:shikimate kinase [Rickettsiales bacterium]
MLNTVFLMGYMGSGKTVVGKHLSNSTNYKFYDLDNFIELRENKKVLDIFYDHNEVYFRKLENKYLGFLSNKVEKKIISLGGGTPCFENNQNIIQNTPDSTSVYLKCSVEELHKRLTAGKAKRPLISHLKSSIELKDFITKHLFERSFFYEKAKLKINTDDLEVFEISKQIENILA